MTKSKQGKKLQCNVFSIPLTKISELHKGAKCLQCTSDFINEIEKRHNTVLFQRNRLSDWSQVFFKPNCMNSKNIYHLCKNLTI